MCECNRNFTLEPYDQIDSEEENKLCSYVLSREEEETCCALSQHLDEEGRLIICIGGLIFNTIAIVILLDKRLANQLFNRLLLCLVVAGNVHLLLGLAETWIIEDPGLNNLYFYFIVIYPFRGITMICIIYMTAMLSLQRYKSVTSPQPNPRVNSTSIHKISWKHVLKYVGPVILLAFAFKLPEFFEIAIKRDTIRNNEENIKNDNENQNLTILSEENEVNEEYTISTKLILSTFRMDYYYVLLYMNIVNIIVTGIIPLIMLAYLNFRIYKSMRTFMHRHHTLRGQRKQTDKQTAEVKNQRTQTIILFVIVIIFVLCHFLRIILNVEELILHWTTFRDLSSQCRYAHSYWYYISTPISETLLKINSSVNFFVYCFFNQSFRKVINEKFSKALKVLRFLKCTKSSESRSEEKRPKESILVFATNDASRNAEHNMSEL